jgi:hypothetical protein
MNTPPSGQARLAIVGATGMVGGYALRFALGHRAVGVVTAIGRRSLGSRTQAEGGSASRFRGLLWAHGRALGPGRSGLLPGCVAGGFCLPQARLRSFRL